MPFQEPQIAPEQDILAGMRPPPPRRKPEADSYDDLIDRHGEAEGVDPDLIRAIIHGESSGNPNAVSPKNARGLMQLIPATAARFGTKNIHDPDENIRGGARYLRFLNDRFKGDTDLVLAGYNAGEGAVEKFGNKIPPYAETQAYVPAVRARYDKLKRNRRQSGPQPQFDLAAGTAPPEGSGAEFDLVAGTRPPLGQEETQEPAPPQVLTERNQAAITRPRTVAGQYDTSLTPEEESQFGEWKRQFAPNDTGEDYDLRGAFKSGLRPDAKTGHWPDTFKKPNHPTFSNESKYATGADASKAGRWEGDKFIPASTAPSDPSFEDAREITNQWIESKAKSIDRAYAGSFDPKFREGVVQYDEATRRQKIQAQQQRERQAQQRAFQAKRQKIVNGARQAWIAEAETLAKNADPELAKKLVDAARNASTADVVKYARNRGTRMSNSDQFAANMGRERRGGFSFTPPTIAERMPVEEKPEERQAQNRAKLRAFREEHRRIPTPAEMRSIGIIPAKTSVPEYPSEAQQIISERIAPKGDILGSVAQQWPRFLSYTDLLGSKLAKLAGKVVELPKVSSDGSVFQQDVASYLEQRSAMWNEVGSYTPPNLGLSKKVTRSIINAGYDVARIGAMVEASGLSLPTALVGESVILHSDQDAETQAKEAAKAYALGWALSKLPVYAQRGVGQIPGVIGKTAIAHPEIVARTIGALGFGGFGAAEAKARGASNEEATIEGVSMGVIGAGLAGGGLKRIGRAIKEAPDVVIASERSPEWLRETAGRATGKTPVVIQSEAREGEDPRFASVYVDPKDPTQHVSREVSADEASTLLGKDRPARIVPEHQFNRVFGPSGGEPPTQPAVQPMNRQLKAGGEKSPTRASKEPDLKSEVVATEEVASKQPTSKTLEVQKPAVETRKVEVQTPLDAAIKPAKSPSLAESVPQAVSMPSVSPSVREGEKVVPQSEPPSTFQQEEARLNTYVVDAWKLSKADAIKLTQDLSAERRKLAASDGHIAAQEKLLAKGGMPADITAAITKSVVGMKARVTEIDERTQALLLRVKPGAPEQPSPQVEAQNQDQDPVKAGKVHSTESAESESQNVEPRKFSSTQVELPAPMAKRAQGEGARMIPDREIYTDPADPSLGRETRSHITVKYGVHAEDDTEVRKAIEGEGSLKGRLGKVSIFAGGPDTPYDVVKVDVKSPDLHRVNQKIAAGTKVTDTHPKYVPHITIAYVKKGEGQKYVGRSIPGVTGEEVTFNDLTFSSKNRSETTIPLGGSSTGLTEGFKHMGGAISESLYRGMFDRLEAGKLPAPFPADKQPEFERLAKQEYDAGRVKSWKDLYNLANPEKAKDVEPAMSDGPLATAQEIHDAGKPIRMLDRDATLSEWKTYDGVSYELYKTDDVGIVRVFDEDSRHVVELIKYPTPKAAGAAYLKAIGDAEKQAGDDVQVTKSKDVESAKEVSDLAKALDSESVRFRSAAHIIKFLTDAPNSRLVATPDSTLRLNWSHGSLRVATNTSKATGARYYLNTRILDAAGDEFVRSGNNMQMMVDGERAEDVIDAIMREGFELETSSYKDEARKIVDVEGERGSWNPAGRIPPTGYTTPPKPSALRNLFNYIKGAPAAISGKAQGLKKNFSAIGRLRDIWVGGLSQLEKANTPTFNAALRAAGAKTTGKMMMRRAANQIQHILKTKDGWDLFRTALVESRLRGVRDRWLNLQQLSQDLDDGDLQDFYAGGGEDDQPGIRPLVALLEGMPFGKQFKEEEGMEKTDSLTGIIDSMLATDEFNGARAYLGTLFARAADSVTSVMDSDDFDTFTGSRLFGEALPVYKNLLENPMNEAHALNEGVFSDALGPLDTYYPLTALDDKGDMLHRVRTRVFRGTEYRPPDNPRNKMATGLSPDYDVTPEALGHAVSTAERRNTVARLLKVAEDNGLIKTLKRKDPSPDTIVGPDGVEYAAKVVQKKKDRTLFINGRTIHVPGQRVAVPEWLHRELKPILEDDDYSQGAIASFASAVNLFGMAGPLDAAMHTANVIGALVVGTPYVGTDILSKTIGNTPVTKLLTTWINLATTDPWTDDAVADIEAMSKMGIIPSRYGTVVTGWLARGRQFAGETGAKKKWLSLAPLLYGPGGIDIRARLMMYRLAKHMAPNASIAETRHFVNMLGNYNYETSGQIEKFLKQFGIAPFYTAGSTMWRTGIKATFGMTPLPTANETRGKRAVLRAAQLLSAGIIGMLGAWLIMYKAYTDKWPWEDDDMKLLQFPLSEKHRHHWLAKKIYGDNEKTAYVGMGFFSPLIQRGLRATGIQPAIDAYKGGATKGQASEEAEREIFNSAIHPFVSGPATQAGTVFLTGSHPYVTGMRDVTGKENTSFLPATKAVRPGASKWAARGIEAAANLNNFYGDIARNIGFVQEPLNLNEDHAPQDAATQPNPWLRMAIDLAAPRLIRGPVDNAKRRKSFIRGAKAIESTVRKAEGQPSTRRRKQTGPSGPPGPSLPGGPQ